MNSFWVPTKLADLLAPISRTVKVKPLDDYPLLGIRLDGGGPFLRETKPGSAISAGTLNKVATGDFIYSRLFAWRGAFGIIGQELDGSLVSNEFPTFTINSDKLDVKFLWHWFRLSETLKKVEAECTGSTPLTRNRYKEIFFLGLEIPLPPLAEQQRIMGKTEVLAAKIGEARSLRGETYQEARTLMESTKNSVFSLSHHRWENKSLEEVAPINMGQSPPGHSYNTHGEGIPLLNGPTEFGDCNPIPIQWTTAPTKLCKKGDILLCVRGATTGRMNWADREYCVGRGLAALTVDTNSCDPRFVYHFVENQTHEMLSLSAGSTFPNLPGAKLKLLQIPVPPQEEQRRIVAYLDGLQTQVDALKTLQAQTAVELDALLPAILDRAFKGEL